MILESYLNENVNYNQTIIDKMIINEGVVESIKKLWEKMKNAFLKFIHTIKMKWENFKMKRRMKKEMDKATDEIINIINELEKNGGNDFGFGDMGLGESVFNKIHRICITRNFKFILRESRLDIDTLIAHILKSIGINFDNSLLQNRDFSQISTNLDHVNYVQLQDNLINILQSMMINSSLVQLISDNSTGIINIKIDYEQLYTLVHVSNTDQVYSITDKVNKDMDNYIKKYDQIYKEIDSISNEISKIKIKQEKDTLLFKYCKIKLKIANDIIAILVRLNEMLQRFQKNNNLKLMDNNGQLILN